MARILIVEDNAANLQLMLYLLKAFGHDAAAAPDGVSGLLATETERFDLVLCDVLMPGIDGFEFARRYKQDAHNTAPLVAVTALAMVGDRERLLAAGFDGYISKPIEPESFVTQIEPFLERSGTPAMERPGTAASEPIEPRGPVILAIDDVQLNIDLVRSSLQPFGFRVLAARSVEEAFEQAKETKPALILCDLHMIGEDGFEMLRRVKASAELNDVPFFFLSSTTWGTSERLRALQLGATKFLVRPIDPRTLRREVEAAIATN